MALGVMHSRTVTPSRRAGYVIAVLVNAGMLLAFNWWPGWEAVPFLSQDVRLVVGFVNVSILVNVAANVVYLFDNRAWVKALGDLATLGVGMAALVRIWQVFPFAFGPSSFDLALAVRAVLVLGIIGSAIGIIAACTSFARSLTAAASDQAE